MSNVVMYGAPPPMEDPRPGLPYIPIIPQTPTPTERAVNLTSLLSKKRVRVAVRVDETGKICVRISNGNDLLAEVAGGAGGRDLVIETEI